MSDDVEKKFAVLCQIQRAQHFAWREAAASSGLDAAALVFRMWEVSGRDTAAAYLPRLDRTRALAPQVAECIAWSSRAMGEDAAAETRGAEGWVCHRACPWRDWHERKSLLEEDRRGCDVWFASVLAELNRALGSRLAFETLETLPEGAPTCLRRIWEER